MEHRPYRRVMPLTHGSPRVYLGGYFGVSCQRKHRIQMKAPKFIWGLFAFQFIFAGPKGRQFLAGRRQPPVPGSPPKGLNEHSLPGHPDRSGGVLFSRFLRYLRLLSPPSSYIISGTSGIGWESVSCCGIVKQTGGSGSKSKKFLSQEMGR